MVGWVGNQQECSSPKNEFVFSQGKKLLTDKTAFAVAFPYEQISIHIVEVH